VFSVISKGHISPLKQRYGFEAKKQANRGKHYTLIGEMLFNPDKTLFFGTYCCFKTPLSC
jgi:hypothetical protein